MASRATRSRNNNSKNTAKRKSNKSRQMTQEPQVTSPGRSSNDWVDPPVSYTSTPSEMNSQGTSEVSPPSSMTSFPSGSSEDREKLYTNSPTTSYRSRPRPGWVQYISKWLPWRTCRWIRDFLTAISHLFTGERWLDGVYSFVLLACFLYCFYIAIEGLLHFVKGVAAQDVDCSVVYVTIPGPIVTVSLIGQTPTDPSHGTYYYSVIDGTTRWLDSVAPPTRTKSPFTTVPVLTPTASSPGFPPTPEVPPPSSLSLTGELSFVSLDL